MTTAKNLFDDDYQEFADSPSTAPPRELRPSFKPKTTTSSLYSVASVFAKASKAIFTKVLWLLSRCSGSSACPRRRSVRDENEEDSDYDAMGTLSFLEEELTESAFEDDDESADDEDVGSVVEDESNDNNGEEEERRCWNKRFGGRVTIVAGSAGRRLAHLSVTGGTKGSSGSSSGLIGSSSSGSIGSSSGSSGSSSSSSSSGSIGSSSSSGSSGSSSGRSGVFKSGNTFKERRTSRWKSVKGNNKAFVSKSKSEKPDLEEGEGTEHSKTMTDDTTGLMRLTGEKMGSETGGDDPGSSLPGEGKRNSQRHSKGGRRSAAEPNNVFLPSRHDDDEEDIEKSGGGIREDAVDVFERDRITTTTTLLDSERDETAKEVANRCHNRETDGSWETDCHHTNVRLADDDDDDDHKWKACEGNKNEETAALFFDSVDLIRREQHLQFDEDKKKPSCSTNENSNNNTTTESGLGFEVRAEQHRRVSCGSSTCMGAPFCWLASPDCQQNSAESSQQQQQQQQQHHHHAFSHSLPSGSLTSYAASLAGTTTIPSNQCEGGGGITSAANAGRHDNDCSAIIMTTTATSTSARRSLSERRSPSSAPDDHRNASMVMLLPPPPPLPGDVSSHRFEEKISEGEGEIGSSSEGGRIPFLSSGSASTTFPNEFSTRDENDDIWSDNSDVEEMLMHHHHHHHGQANLPKVPVK